ncbi:hypothetical protein [Blastococcus deserti]|uniref:Uncharacterized protein n=1 Tax=Blastococcus deserti TaxID=2259033 RepID=A0ABW4XG05_9ACTN
MVPARPLEDARQWAPSALVSHTLAELDGRVVIEAGAENAFQVAAVGRLATREELSSWAKFGAEVQAVTDATFFEAQVGGSSIIDDTVRGLTTLYAEAPFAKSLVLLYVIGAETTFEDVLWFWNARAMRPGEEGASLLLGYDQVLPNRDALVDLVRQTARGTPSLSVVSVSVPRADLESLLESVIGIARHEGTKWTEGLFRTQTVEPTAVINGDPRPFWSGTRHVGAATDQTTALYRPRTTVTFLGPLSFAPAFTGQPADLRLRSKLFDVPRRPAVAELFDAQATWAGDALRLRSRLQRRYELPLALPSPEHVLKAAVTLPYEPSDKARQLRAVLEREAGRLEPYRDPVVVSVIEALTPDDTRKLKRELQKLDAPDRESVLAMLATLRSPRPRTLHDLASNLPPPSSAVPASRVAAALAELVDRGHVQRGLRADCTLCDTHDLRQLDDAAAPVTCRACGAPAVYDVGDHGEPRLYYLLAPVMRLISANGGLPVLAAAGVLQSEGLHLVAGAQFVGTDEDFEVDLLGWGGTKVYAGEMKKQPAGFTDVESDVRNSVRFGADVHVAATFGAVDDTLRARLEEACAAENIELRVLDIETLLTHDQPATAASPAGVQESGDDPADGRPEGAPGVA